MSRRLPDLNFIIFTNFGNFSISSFLMQIVIMIITLAVYGFAPVGFERKRITGTVQTTSLAHEEVGLVGKGLLGRVVG